MSAPDQYAIWRAALTGTLPVSAIGDPPSGFWRTDSGEAIAIWRDADGALCCERQKFDGGTGMSAEAIDELYASASRYPIDEATHDAARAGNPPVGYATRLTLKEIAAGTVWSLALGAEKAAAEAAKLAARQEREVEAEERRQQRQQRRSA